MPGLESEIEELLAQRALKLNRDELLLLDVRANVLELLD